MTLALKCVIFSACVLWSACLKDMDGHTRCIDHCYLLTPEVGDVVGVADSTIRQSYRLLYPAKGQLFPQDFHFATSLEDLPKH